jgi:hypothetical protein
LSDAWPSTPRGRNVRAKAEGLLSKPETAAAIPLRFPISAGPRARYRVGTRAVCAPILSRRDVTRAARASNPAAVERRHASRSKGASR